jgi:phosphoesterase RecJ-like protein
MTGMPTTVKEAAAALADARDILLLTHKRPDGDTLGSAAALCRGLRILHKTAYLKENPEVTAKYAPYVEELIAPADFMPGFIAAVDVASRDMLPLNTAKFALPYLNSTRKS